MRKLFLILTFIPMLCFAENDVLQQFFSNLETNTLEGDFSFTMQESVSQPLTYNGSIKMRGEQFWVRLMGMEVSWDGNTLYNYNEDNNELTLSVPSDAELAEANPLLYAKSLVDNCEVMVNDRGTQWQVILTPLNKDVGVQAFAINLRKQDLMPLEAKMKESATKQTILRLKNAKYTTTAPSFRLEIEGAEINDLR